MFSLSEALVTLALMSLVAASIGVGITSALSAYRNNRASSEASVLCGTLAVELADELRFARDIAGEGEAVIFTSLRYGSQVAVEGAAGRVLIGGRQVLGEKAYTGLDAQTTVAYEDGAFQVTILVTHAGELRAQAQFEVTPLTL